MDWMERQRVEAALWKECLLRKDEGLADATPMACLLDVLGYERGTHGHVNLALRPLAAQEVGKILAQFCPGMIEQIDGRPKIKVEWP